jgi:FixJ family two-component response regulator
VIEDDPAFIDALGRSLRGAGLQVASFGAAEPVLEAYQATPGCLVADIRLPRLSGLELQEVLAKRGVPIPIVFITGHGDVAMAVTALKRGAVDFLEKPFAEQALLDSVDLALAHDRKARSLVSDRSLITERLAQLTPREREVFALVVADKSAKQITAELGISPRTVEHHREHVMAKMDAVSWHDLFNIAVIGGLYEPRL